MIEIEIQGGLGLLIDEVKIVIVHPVSINVVLDFVDVAGKIKNVDDSGINLLLEVGVFFILMTHSKEIIVVACD